MTDEVKRAANTPVFGGHRQRSLCLHMSVTLLLVPPTASPLGTGLPAYPTHREGGEAE